MPRKLTLDKPPGHERYAAEMVRRAVTYWLQGGRVRRNGRRWPRTWTAPSTSGPGGYLIEEQADGSLTCGCEYAVQHAICKHRAAILAAPKPHGPRCPVCPRHPRLFVYADHIDDVIAGGWLYRGAVRCRRCGFATDLPQWAARSWVLTRTLGVWGPATTQERARQAAAALFEQGSY